MVAGKIETLKTFIETCDFEGITTAKGAIHLSEVNCARSEKSVSAKNTNCVRTFNTDMSVNNSLCSLRVTS
jgi:hypothetical protein